MEIARVHVLLTAVPRQACVGTTMRPQREIPSRTLDTADQPSQAGSCPASAV